MSQDFLARLWDKVAVGTPDDCWPWMGQTDRDGYGLFYVSRDGRRWCTRAHVIAWELGHRLPMPAGMCGLHTCDVPGCCNPHHVFPGTKADNNEDMARKGRRRTARGEDGGAARLTTARALAIRASTERTSVLARQHHVTPATICDLRHGRTWRHL